MTPDLEALKATYTAAKAAHHETVKAIVEAKRIADAARWRMLEAFRAYNEARPPSQRPKSRPKHVTNPADLFAP